MRRLNKAATYQIHTVPRARNKTHVADGIESAEFVERKTLVHEVDGHELDGAEAAVDAPNQLVHCRTQILILFDILTRRYSKLYQDHLSAMSALSMKREL